MCYLDNKNLKNKKTYYKYPGFTAISELCSVNKADSVLYRTLCNHCSCAAYADFIAEESCRDFINQTTTHPDQ